VLYRRYYRRFNITFSPDRDTVSFRYYTWYQFDKNNSIGPDPFTSYVYNINPVYLGVMLNTGGERYSTAKKKLVTKKHIINTFLHVKNQQIDEINDWWCH